MNKLQKLTFSISILLLVACNSKQSDYNATSKVVTEEEKAKADLILQNCIKAHGGELYKNAHYSFVFREKNYTFKNEGLQFEYRMNGLVKGERISDELINNEFKRRINGVEIDLSHRKKLSYSNSLNSVIYFATLPYKLLDKAVNVNHRGSVSIKGQNYEVLEVTFTKEGGGIDHDDEYYYWINKESNKIDYLAYNYSVNNGGVRFRTAYNTRVVGGITFQDYVNYKAKLRTALKDLPSLYENNELEELSKIKTENIINLAKNI